MAKFIRVKTVSGQSDSLMQERDYYVNLIRSYLYRKAHSTRIDLCCVLSAPIREYTSPNQRRTFYHGLAGHKVAAVAERQTA